MEFEELPAISNEIILSHQQKNNRINGNVNNALISFVKNIDDCSQNLLDLNNTLFISAQNFLIFFQENKEIVDNFNQLILPNNQLIENLDSFLPKIENIIYTGTSSLSERNLRDEHKKIIDNINMMANTTLWYITSDNTRFMIRLMHNTKDKLMNQEVTSNTKIESLEIIHRNKHNELSTQLDRQNSIVKQIVKLEKKPLMISNYIQKCLKALNNQIILTDLNAHLALLGSGQEEIRRKIEKVVNETITIVENSKEQDNQEPQEEYVLPTLQQQIHKFLVSFKFINKITQLSTSVNETKQFIKNFSFKKFIKFLRKKFKKNQKYYVINKKIFKKNNYLYGFTNK